MSLVLPQLRKSWLVMFLIFFWAFSATAAEVGTGAHYKPGSCARAGTRLPEHGSAMLQEARVVAKLLPALEELGADGAPTASQPDGGLDFSEDEFTAMQAECCFASFDNYSRQLLVHLGMEICDEGCHNGFMPFFNCGKSSLQDYKNAIQKNSLELCACYLLAGKCLSGGLPEKCAETNTGHFDPSFHRRRVCSKATVTTGTTTTTTTLHPALQTCDPGLLSEAEVSCKNALQSDPLALETWRSNCLIEVCIAGPGSAQNISRAYDISGDPTDRCSDDMQAYATSACYKELIASCDATKAWLDACVQDVCAADNAGLHDPVGAAQGYCGPQEDLADFLKDFGGLLPTTTSTTSTPSVSNETIWGELCEGGPHEVYKPSPRTDPEYVWPECAIPVSLEQCNWYYDNHHGSGNGSLKVTPQSYGIRYPSGCFYYMGKSWSADKQNAGAGSHGDEWMGWNTGQGGAKKAVNAGYRLCCGPRPLMPTTTTTTTMGKFPPPVLTEPPSDRPPLRPIGSSRPLANIDRPANAVFGLCKVYGDPHIFGFDTPIKKFDSFRTGNFWIVRSSAVWIQGHYFPGNLRRPTVTYLRKVAIGGPFLQGNTMMIETSNSWWNDDSHILSLSSVGRHSWTGMSGGVTATSQSNGTNTRVSIALPFDVRVKIGINAGNVRPKGNKLAFMSLLIGMRQITGQDGHCGNFNQVASDDSEVLDVTPVAPSEVLIPF